MLESTLREDIRTMEFPHQRHVGYPTALDTQGLNDTTSHHQASHIRVNSLSSKGSSSDFSVLRTPQDSLLSDTDAVIKEERGPATWQVDQITSSPVEEFRIREKPVLNTSIAQRPTRPGAFSAHPGQRQILPTSNQGSNAPRSATAAFPPMLLPAPARPQPIARAEVTPTAETPTATQQQGQHRRTQSAPLLSLAPIQTVADVPAIPQQPQVTSPYNRMIPGANVEAVNMPAPPSYASLSGQVVPTTAPATQIAFTSPAGSRPFVGATTFAPPFPAFPAPTGQAPVMWPYFPPQAPRTFFTPPATIYSSPTPLTWKVINPNSQPQMPLSHLIGQANGMILGGPSAHNRKIGLYKTEICRNWEEKQSCRYGVKCQFAHGANDLRTVPRHPKYKTEICRTFWVTGSCPYGKRCCFIHPSTTSGGPQPPLAPPIDDGDRETQHTISLLARLDLKRGSPETAPGGARQTPDTDVSDRSFIYPGMGEAVKV